jgi:hypothetical protein
MSPAIRLLIAVVCIAAPSATRAEQSSAGTREISQVAGDLYKVTEGDKATVFVVGGTTILLADPLSADFVRWWRAEVNQRFPGRVTRYVVYSSHQYERAAGGAAFLKEGEIIAHEAFSSLRRNAAESLPPSWASFDSDRNNVLDRSESTALGSAASGKDFNNDGVLTGGEAWSDVSGPETTYARRRIVEFEGRRVELIHPGDGLGADLTLLLFPKERVLFVPGVPLKETPNTFAPASAFSFIDTLRQIEQIEFDRLLSGTGETHSRSDLAAVREYAEAVVSGVKGGLRVGSAVEQLQANLDLQQFSQLRNFDQRRGRNIEEVYRGLRLITVSASGAAQFMHLQRGVPDCAVNAVPTFEVECIGVGGPTMSGIAIADVMVGRMGGAFEFWRSGPVRGTEQRFISSPTYFESREMGMAYMFRYHAGRTLGMTGVVTGGITRLTVTQQVDGPNAFWYPGNFDIETRKTIPIFGVDFTISKGPLKFVAPIRVMHEPVAFFSEVGSTASKWSIRAGIGLGGDVATLVH